MTRVMKVADFDYQLPGELIAQHPAEKRDESRMLIMDRQTGHCELRMFHDIVDCLRPGDCLVVNDTKVIAARLVGTRPTGGKVEVLLLEPLPDGGWQCMMKPGRRMRPSGCVLLDGVDGKIVVRTRRDDGTFDIDFIGTDAESAMTAAGRVPLPPYIEREAGADDSERYQTVYADRPGAIAAPTAGLHFTPAILDRLDQKGVATAYLTLHVGPGTFQPVKAEDVTGHTMHEERFELSAETAGLVNGTRRKGRRIIAVGTTSVRVLESCWDPDSGQVIPGKGRTRLFLHPPAKPRAVDGLLTNFHLPKSTLIMLVSTFSSVEKVLAAYRLAIRERLRFYSYGDCMLLIDR